MKKLTMKTLPLTAAFVFLTAPVFAQDVNDLANEYVNMPEIQAMVSDMFSAESMGAQVAANMPPSVKLTAIQQARIGAVMSDAMNDIRPRMFDLMATHSAEIFTAAELKALIAFYGSEHGASIMQKTTPFMTRVMSELAPEMQAVQAKVTPEIVKIMQEQ